MFQVHMTGGSWNCKLLKLRSDARAWENFRSRCTDLKTRAWGNINPPREKLYTETLLLSEVHTLFRDPYFIPNVPSLSQDPAQDTTLVFSCHVWVPLDYDSSLDCSWLWWLRYLGGSTGHIFYKIPSKI